MEAEKKSADDLLDELRLAALEALEVYVGKDKISAEEAEHFLCKSYRTIYSWLSGKKMYLPQLEDIKSIVEFIKLVEQLTEKWKKVVTEFHGERNGMIGFYDRDMLRVLEGDEPIETKIVSLVKLSLRKLAAGKKVSLLPGK
jgi:hypothetical protein